MKILLVGSKKEWALENHYLKHLGDLGAKVAAFEAHDFFYDFYYKNLWNKIVFRIGISSIYSKINNQLLAIVEQDKFDVVWVFKGMELFPETLHKIKSSGAKIVNLNPDHPFVHSYRGSGNTNVLNSIGVYDLHLSYSLIIKERIEEDFKIKCKWLPFGFEVAEVSLPKKGEEILRACFIGNPDRFRAKTLKKLAIAGIPISLYGNNWKKWIGPGKDLDILYHEAIYKEDFNRVATSYRLQLNIFRPYNVDSHNMRSLEMPALGCIMLAPNSKEHRLLFKVGEEILIYNDYDEMLKLTSHILDMSYEDALQFRIKGYSRAINSAYSYRERSSEVLCIFKRLVNGDK